MTITETSPELRQKFDERAKKIAQYRKEVQKQHYEDIQTSRSRGVPVAYCSGFGPTEPLYAMGIQPCMPENYVTICCAKQMAEKFCEAAEARGMQREMCSYSRVGLGMMWLNDGPMGALPKPDMIIAYPLLCDPHAKWWEVTARYFDVPLFRFDGPFNFSGKVEKYHIDWLVAQFKDLFAFIEKVTGKKFDHAKFQEAMALSGKTLECFREITDYRKTIPCPWGLRETVGDLFYLVTQMGTPGALEYYSMVRDDVKERAENKIGIIPNEKLRLMWDNIPLWYRLQLFDYFSERGAVFAIDTYPTVQWCGYIFDGGRIDPEKAFESLALFHVYKDAHTSLDYQIKRQERMVKEWHIDGAVYFSNIGCQILSRAVPEKERLFRERTGALSMSFEAMMADPRSLYEADVKARIDNFLELLEQRKK